MITRLKKLFLKLFIWICLILWLWVLSSFFVQKINLNISTQIAVAQDPATPQNQNPQQSSDETLLKNLESVLKVLYLMLWPALVVAWKSLDNSLVYWSVFHLDVYLWQFWNMMKNFANYVLWFIFLLSIFLYFFNINKLKNISEPKKLIPKLLIAWVWIQASWFIVWALIDISTILVYWVGAMPLSVFKAEELWQNKAMPQLAGSINLTSNTSQDWKKDASATNSDKVQSSADYYCEKSWKKEKFYSCIFSWSSLDKEIQTKIPNWYNKDYCVYWWFLYQTNPGSDEKRKESNLVPLTISDASNQFWCTAPSDIMKKSGWMVWPLMTMYTSILNMSKFAITSNNKVTWAITMEFIMKIFIAIALFIPLMTLAVVLVVRVVVLWLVIWFSPIIVLANVFEFKKWMWEKASLWSLLGLIFLPVTATFGICISILFLTVLLQSTPDKAGKNSVLNWMWLEKCANVETGKYCVKTSVGNELTINQSWANIWEFTELIPWLIINLLWIWLMWAIVFTSMKTTKITQWIVDNFDKFGKNLASSMHVPWVPWLSYAWLKAVPGALWWVAENLVSKERQEVASRIENSLNWGNNPWGTWSAPSNTSLTIASPESWNILSPGQTIAVDSTWAISWLNSPIRDTTEKNKIVRELLSHWANVPSITWLWANLPWITDINTIFTALEWNGNSIIKVKSWEMYADRNKNRLYVKEWSEIKSYWFNFSDTSNWNIEKLVNFARSKSISKQEFDNFWSPFKEKAIQDQNTVKYQN